MTTKAERIDRYNRAIETARARQALPPRRQTRMPLSDFIEEVTERVARGDIPEVIASGLGLTIGAVHRRLLRNNRLDLWEAARANEYREHDWIAA